MLESLPKLRSCVRARTAREAADGSLPRLGRLSRVLISLELGKDEPGGGKEMVMGAFNSPGDGGGSCGARQGTVGDWYEERGESERLWELALLSSRGGDS